MSFVPGKGAVLNHIISATANPIGEVVSLGISKSRTSIDKTNTASTGKEYIGGLVGATVSLTLNLDVSNANQNTLSATINTCANQDLSIVLKDCAGEDLVEYEFSAFLTKWDIQNIENDKIATVSAELQVSGAITTTVAS